MLVSAHIGHLIDICWMRLKIIIGFHLELFFNLLHFLGSKLKYMMDLYAPVSSSEVLEIPTPFNGWL